MTESGINDFTFLSPSMLLVVRPFGEFEVYHFRVLSGDRPAHRRADDLVSDHQDVDICTYKRTTVNVPTLLATFLLPPLASGGSYKALSVRCKPCPAFAPSQDNVDALRRADDFDDPANQARPKTSPSYPDLEDRILAFSLEVSNDKQYAEIFPLMLVVDIKAIFSSLPSS